MLDGDTRHKLGAGRNNGTLREQQKEITRQRLIHGAVEVFERDGYVGSRVADIAAAAGASRATFYLHFKGKLDVAREFMDPLRAESEELYRELDALIDPSWDQMHEWMSRVIDYWHRNRDVITVVNQAIAVEPEFAGYLVAAAEASASAMTNHLGQWSGAQRETARLRITMFVLQLERVCYFWIIRDVPFAREDTLTALTDSLCVALNMDQCRSLRGV